MKNKYRVNKDWAYPGTHWSVEVKIWWWPFWVEERGMLCSQEDAEHLKNLLESQQ